MASESRYSQPGKCKVGDIVLFQDGESILAAKVLMHCDIVGVPITSINPFTFVSSVSCGYSIWQAVDAVEFIATDDILDVLTYRNVGDNKIGVLLPAEFR